MQFCDIIPRSHICEQLGVSSSTIKRWTQTRKFPKPLKASGREPLYQKTEIANWLSDMEGNHE